MLIGVDVETGGLNSPKTDALLTAYLQSYAVERHVLRGTFRLVPHNSLSLTIQPEGLDVSEEALKINKIDVKEHTLRAISRKDAARLLAQFISSVEYGLPKSTSIWWKRLQTPTAFVGWNVHFDVGFLNQLLTETTTDVRLPYRNVDVHSLYYVHRLNDMPEGSLSLSNAARYFGILKEHEGIPHTAAGDVHITMEVFNCCLSRQQR